MLMTMLLLALGLSLLRAPRAGGLWDSEDADRGGGYWAFCMAQLEKLINADAVYGQMEQYHNTQLVARWTAAIAPRNIRPAFWREDDV